MTSRPAQLVVIVYGKGGVGKTTLSAHLAARYAATGKKVLLVGCDPKADTSARFLGGRRPRTILDLVEGRVEDRFGELVTASDAGVDIIETGGPEPGLGCGGRGVATLCQFLERHPLELRGYDALILDVLGDLVCGGFASPLRFARTNSVFIVSSEEPASLFAANNIARMVVRPLERKASLGGIIFNMRSNDFPRKPLEEFAARLGAEVTGFVQRDMAVLAAEASGTSVAAYAPGSRAAREFAAIADAVERRARGRPARKPTPMASEEFWAFVRSRRLERL